MENLGKSLDEIIDKNNRGGRGRGGFNKNRFQNRPRNMNGNNVNRNQYREERFGNRQNNQNDRNNQNTKLMGNRNGIRRNFRGNLRGNNNDRNFYRNNDNYAPRGRGVIQKKYNNNGREPVFIKRRMTNNHNRNFVRGNSRGNSQGNSRGNSQQFGMKRMERRNDRWQKQRSFSSRNGPRQFERDDGSSVLRPVSRRLFVSNIKADYSNFELQNIFSKVGDLKRCGLHWDKLGNSRGTADIEFFDVRDAKNAIYQLHNANIDGQSMFVQYARRSGSDVVKFRPQGLKLGRRRENGNNNNGNGNNGSKNFYNNNNRRN